MNRYALSTRPAGLLLGALGFYAALLPTTPVQAAPNPYFGVNVQSVINYLRPDAPVPATDTARPIGDLPALSLDPTDRWSTLFAAAADDGIGTARIDAPWQWVEPTPPNSSGSHTYMWDTNDGSARYPRYKNLDNVIGHLALAGIRALPVLDYAPRWAQIDLGHAGDPWYGNPYAPPSAATYGHFAAYAGALARRYGRPHPGECAANQASFWCSNVWLATGRPAMPITTYEVWNEENHVFNWPPAVNADAYVAMFNQVRDAIRAQDAAAQVIVGGIVWNDAADYVTDLFVGGTTFTNGGPDGVAIHPYGPTPFSVLTNTRVVAAALTAVGQGSLPIYQTELGWPRWDPSMNTPVSMRAVSPFVSDRARAGTMALVVDAMITSDCPIASFVAYALAERENGPPEVGYSGYVNDPNSAEQWMGLYGRRTGAATLESRAYAQSIATKGTAAMVPYRPPICGIIDSNASPPLLLLDLAVRMTSDRCVATQITYKGWPIEEAFVHAIPAGGAAVTVPTDAEGNAGVCVAAAPTSIDVVANVPHAAVSRLKTVTCTAEVPGCRGPR